MASVAAVKAPTVVVRATVPGMQRASVLVCMAAWCWLPVRTVASVAAERAAVLMCMAAW